MSLMLTLWLYLAIHAGIGSALADPDEPCFTDECVGCIDDCLGPDEEER